MKTARVSGVTSPSPLRHTLPMSLPIKLTISLTVARNPFGILSAVPPVMSWNKIRNNRFSIIEKNTELTPTA